MLACGHECESHGSPICRHLRERSQSSLSYFRCYTGVQMEFELLCKSCVEERRRGQPIAAAPVCRECFEYARVTIGDLEGVDGSPEVLIRSEPFDMKLRQISLPSAIGVVIDLAPIECRERSLWLLLSEDGRIIEFDADSGAIDHVATGSLLAEPEQDPFRGHVRTRRLHASSDGRFAAIVNDYGRRGEIIDLISGSASLSLDGGEYYPETVPFSFAFAEVKGRTIAIHRTDWNRLDISDPLTGKSLSQRGPTSYRQGEARPAHYLDYFHGALHVSPSGKRIADDGWVWHPIGIPVVWCLEDWVSENVWESEDGSTRRSLCDRAYCWDQPMTWLDDHRIAVGGLGEDDLLMVAGATIFDASLSRSTDGNRGYDANCPRELIAFAGPAGKFFSDGRCLYSSDPNGLARWDVSDGHRTGFCAGFSPTHHHRGARELVQLSGRTLTRWNMDDD